MKYQKLQIYRLKRISGLDKKGRPAIYLSHFGEQSLVWTGTSVKSKKALDKPFIIIFNSYPTYFYLHNIEKVSTNRLVSKWTDKNNTIYILSQNEQRMLAIKLVSLINERNPYQRVALLEIENQNLKNDIKLLKQQQKIKKEYESEYELE